MATEKQEKAAKLLVENGRSVSRAMRAAGYSKKTATAPAKLTKSKAWPLLLEKYLPDSHLGEKHREFLDSGRVTRVFKKGDLEVETTETDPSAVKALDLAYKLKGRYKDTTPPGNTYVFNNNQLTLIARRVVADNKQIEGPSR